MNSDKNSCYTRNNNSSNQLSLSQSQNYSQSSINFRNPSASELQSHKSNITSPVFYKNSTNDNVSGFTNEIDQKAPDALKVLDELSNVLQTVQMDTLKFKKEASKEEEKENIITINNQSWYETPIDRENINHKYSIIDDCMAQIQRMLSKIMDSLWLSESFLVDLNDTVIDVLKTNAYNIKDMDAKNYFKKFKKTIMEELKKVFAIRDTCDKLTFAAKTIKAKPLSKDQQIPYCACRPRRDSLEDDVQFLLERLHEWGTYVCELRETAMHEEIKLLARVEQRNKNIIPADEEYLNIRRKAADIEKTLINKVNDRNNQHETLSKPKSKHNIKKSKKPVNNSKIPLDTREIKSEHKLKQSHQATPKNKVALLENIGDTLNKFIDFERQMKEISYKNDAWKTIKRSALINVENGLNILSKTFDDVKKSVKDGEVKCSNKMVKFSNEIFKDFDNINDFFSNGNLLPIEQDLVSLTEKLQRNLYNLNERLQAVQ